MSKSIREGIDQKLKTMAFPYKIKGWKKMVPNLHFWAKSFRHFDDLQSNLFFPRSVRIDFSRSVVFNLVQRDLLKEIRFFTWKVTKKSYQKKLKKTDEKITLRFKIQFSISKLENAPETILVPNPIAKKKHPPAENIVFQESIFLNLYFIY